MGWDKAMKAVDMKIAQRAGLYVRPLSTKNVEQHMEDVGLDKEFGTHYRMSALSGGQKVKVVLQRKDDHVRARAARGGPAW